MFLFEKKKKEIKKEYLWFSLFVGSGINPKPQSWVTEFNFFFFLVSSLALLSRSLSLFSFICLFHLFPNLFLSRLTTLSNPLGSCPNPKKPTFTAIDIFFYPSTKNPDRVRVSYNAESLNIFFPKCFLGSSFWRYK